MDPSLAESMGVNTKNILISCPSLAESFPSLVNTLTRTATVDVIVVDKWLILTCDCGVISLNPFSPGEKVGRGGQLWVLWPYSLAVSISVKDVLVMDGVF